MRADSRCGASARFRLLALSQASSALGIPVGGQQPCQASHPSGLSLPAMLLPHRVRACMDSPSAQLSKACCALHEQLPRESSPRESCARADAQRCIEQQCMVSSRKRQKAKHSSPTQDPKEALVIDQLQAALSADPVGLHAEGSDGAARLESL